MNIAVTLFVIAQRDQFGVEAASCSHVSSIYSYFFPHMVANYILQIIGLDIDMQLVRQYVRPTSVVTSHWMMIMIMHRFL